jgi:hypothetical protein
MNRQWMFISFDTKRNEPKKSAGYVTFCESQYVFRACTTQTFLMPVIERIVPLVRLDYTGKMGFRLSIS